MHKDRVNTLKGYSLYEGESFEEPRAFHIHSPYDNEDALLKNEEAKEIEEKLSSFLLKNDDTI